MKFTGALSTLLVVIPLLVLQGSAAPALLGNKDGKNSFLGRLGNGNNKNGGTSASNTTATAGASNTTAVAGAANSTASAGTSNAGAAATANSTAGSSDPQTSLTLDPSVIGSNLAQDGQGGAGTTAGQVASATSKNNFINSCVGKTITNGLQIQAGSCNPVPMGDIPAKTLQPTSKFVTPTNLQNFGENQPFTVAMAVSNLNTGNFVNPNTNYFAAPQQLDAQGTIVGHSHFVIQTLPSITSTQPLDPSVFAFFQGLNGKAAANGQLSALLAKGLPSGAYRVFSINTAANHQPVLGPVAQHGSFDDAVYFTVGEAAKQQAANDIATASGTTSAPANGTAAAPPAAANATAAAPPAAAPPAAANATAAAPPAAASPAGGANPGAAKGKGKKGGRRSFMIMPEN